MNISLNDLNNFMVVIISIYILFSHKIPSNVTKILNNNIFKIFILFLMIVISNNYLMLSLLICIAYVITIQNSPTELFGNCLCHASDGLINKKETCPLGQKMIHIHGLLPFCGDPNKHLD
jgi:hypothetical protein